MPALHVKEKWEAAKGGMGKKGLEGRDKIIGLGEEKREEEG